MSRAYATWSVARLEDELRRVHREIDDLEAQCNREAGFSPADPRVPRMSALADEQQELAQEIGERAYLHAEEDDDDLDQI